MVQFDQGIATPFFVAGCRQENAMQDILKKQVQERLLRLPQVLEILPISRSSFWAGIRSGVYPPGRKLTSRTTVWRLSQIMAVVNGRSWEVTDD